MTRKKESFRIHKPSIRRRGRGRERGRGRMRKRYYDPNYSIRDWCPTFPYCRRLVNQGLDPYGQPLVNPIMSNFVHAYPYRQLAINPTSTYDYNPYIDSFIDYYPEYGL